MATIHGKMSAFDPALEDWRAYMERFDLYRVANDIDTSEKKRAVLLSVCGPKTYQHIRSVVAPTKPIDKSYEDIIALITKYYSPEPSFIMQRFKFHSRTRGKGESVAEYVAALRQLSEFCNYGDKLLDMLRDKLVVGINDERIQRKLLTESDLTFDKDCSNY